MQQSQQTEPETAVPSPNAETEAVAFLLNGQAGSCDVGAATDLIEKLGAEHGIAVKVVAFGAGSDLTALAREAVESGAKMVVAGGGDGTINAVASALVGTETALGILPLGTLNHFAKDLGIPLKLEAAIRTLFDGHTIAVDVGEINGKVFLNNSSLGLYPRIVRQREVHRKHGMPKWLALLRGMAYVARHHRSVYLRLKIGDARAKFRKTPFVFVGNNRYALAGLSMGKRDTLTGGHLWICKAPDVGSAGLFRLTLRALAGLVKDRDLEANEAQEAWIETSSSHAHVSTDGEIQPMKGPLHYRIRPEALRVIVPLPAPPVA